MGRGGKYLNHSRKKGKGVKVFLVVLAVLVVVGGVAAFVGMRYMNSLLDMIPRAEIVEQSVSFEEIQDILNYNPDQPTGTDLQAAEITADPSATETAPETTAGSQ